MITKEYRYFFILVAIYVLLQVIYVAFLPLPFFSDSLNYLNFAKSAMSEGTYYPNPKSIYNPWIAAPTYINYLIGLLSLNSNPIIILVFNIILNTTQLLLVFLITRKLFDLRTATIASILYVFYLNNLGLVLLNYTELFFGVMILWSIYLYFGKENYWAFLFCGFMAGLALGARPTAYALIFAYVIVYIYQLISKKANHKKALLMLIGVCMFIVPMGFLSKVNIGSFIYTSTTGPANLIMSANENATGVYDDYIFKNDSILNSKQTYKEKDEYLMKRSIDFILKNPFQYLSLIPRKIYSTFIADSWAIGEVLHSQKWTLNKYMKASKGSSDRKEFDSLPLGYRILFFAINIFHQLWYMIIVLAFVYQIFVFINKSYWSSEKLIVNLFVIIGVSMSILSSVGNPRYKYNFLIAGLILVAPVIKEMLDKLKRTKRNNKNLNSI